MIKKCKMGHYYNDEVDKDCPYCKNQKRDTQDFHPEDNINPTIYGIPPIEEKKHALRSLRKCKNGHIYWGTKDTECPFCSKKKEKKKDFAPENNFLPCVYGGPPIEHNFDPAQNRPMYIYGSPEIMRKRKAYIICCPKCNQTTEIFAINKPTVCCNCGNTEIIVKEK